MTFDPATRVVVDRDLQYRNVGGRSLHLDTYRPAETDAQPAVVYVHGGAWSSGSKGQFSRYAVNFADQGYVGVDPNYRLAPDATISEMLADVRAAVHWTHEHAEALGVDSDCIGIAGHSAGAHLAALATLAPTEIVPDEDESPEVQAFAGFSGIYDFRDEEKYTALVGDHEDAVAEASPITWVDSTAPPTFLAHAVDDETAPIDNTDAFYERLLEAGISVDRFRADGGGHTFLYEDMGWYERTTERFASFLDRHL